MVEEIVFRAGVPGDAQDFARLDNLCFPPGVAFSAGTFRYHLGDPRSVNVVAESSSGIVGFSVGRVYRGGEGGIVTVDVHADYRRLGLGGELLSRLEAGLVSKGAGYFVLQVAVNNEAGLTLYKKAGYRIHSLLEGYYLFPNMPGGLDAYLMVKFL